MSSFSGEVLNVFRDIILYIVTLFSWELPQTPTKNQLLIIP